MRHLVINPSGGWWGSSLTRSTESFQSSVVLLPSTPGTLHWVQWPCPLTPRQAFTSYLATSWWPHWLTCNPFVFLLSVWCINLLDREITQWKHNVPTEFSPALWVMPKTLSLFFFFFLQKSVNPLGNKKCSNLGKKPNLSPLVSKERTYIIKK